MPGFQSFFTFNLFSFNSLPVRHFPIFGKSNFFEIDTFPESKKSCQKDNTINEKIARLSILLFSVKIFLEQIKNKIIIIIPSSLLRALQLN